MPSPWRRPGQIGNQRAAIGPSTMPSPSVSGWPAASGVHTGDRVEVETRELLQSKIIWPYRCG
jgi:hypothetical protein